MLAVDKGEHSAMDFLVECVPHPGGHVLESTGTTITVELGIEHPDGRITPYLLHVEAKGKGVMVREVSPSNLPGFCPARHINSDGSFCLSFPEVERFGIDDEEQAAHWWMVVYKFLQLQRRAAARRSWPEPEWAHGSAAYHQHRAEQAASAISSDLGVAMKANRLSVTGRRRGNHGCLLRVLLDGQRLYAIWPEINRVMTKRRPCLCADEFPLAISSCAHHEEQAVMLARSLKGMEAAEAEFWGGFAGRKCCGTMDGCPLPIEEAA